MKECGQNLTILTNDQQLYRLASNVKLVYQERYSDFIPRLDGMHMFEFYWLCWRIDGRQWTTVENIMRSSFGGVAQMLSGKKFQRLVTEELLRAHLEGCESHKNML